MGILIVCLVIFAILVQVVVVRWVFRIDKIVSLLEEIKQAIKGVD